MSFDWRGKPDWSLLVGEMFGFLGRHFMGEYVVDDEGTYTNQIRVFRPPESEEASG